MSPSKERPRRGDSDQSGRGYGWIDCEFGGDKFQQIAVHHIEICQYFIEKVVWTS